MTFEYTYDEFFHIAADREIFPERWNKLVEDVRNNLFIDLNEDNWQEIVKYYELYLKLLRAEVKVKNYVLPGFRCIR